MGTKVQVVYSVNREGIAFALDSREREKFPAGRARIYLAFIGRPALELLSPADIRAIGSLLTALEPKEVDVEFVEP